MTADRPPALPSTPSSGDDSGLKGHLQTAEAERRARRRTRDRWITRLVVLILGPLAIASYFTDIWWQERERQSALSAIVQAIEPAALSCMREAMSELPQLRRQSLVIRPDPLRGPANIEQERLSAATLRAGGADPAAIDAFLGCLNDIPRPPAREGEPAERLVLEPCDALAAHPLTDEERAATDDGRVLLGDWSSDRARCLDGHMRLAKRAQLRKLLRREGPSKGAAGPTDAAAQIAYIGTREALDVVVGQLAAVESASPATYAGLARAIGRQPLALPWVKQRLTDRAWEVRRGAVRDLRHHGAPTDRAALLLPLRDDTHELVRLAVEVELLHAEHGPTVERVRARLQSARVRTRADRHEAVQVLGLIASAGSRPLAGPAKRLARRLGRRAPDTMASIGGSLNAPPRPLSRADELALIRTLIEHPHHAFAPSPGLDEPDIWNVGFWLPGVRAIALDGETFVLRAPVAAPFRQRRHYGVGAADGGDEGGDEGGEAIVRNCLRNKCMGCRDHRAVRDDEAPHGWRIETDALPRR